MRLGFRRQFLAAAGFAFLLIPVAAEADSPVETALRGLVATIDASPGWTASFRRITYDQATDTAVLSGLVIATPQGEVKIDCEAVSVAGYAPASDGGFTAKSVKTEGVAVDFGPVKTAIDDVSLDDLGVPQVPGGLFDPEKPFTSIMSIYAKAMKASLGHGHIGSLSVIETVEGITTRISYQNFELSGIKDGKTASITAGPVRMQSNSPQGPIDMTVAGVEATDMDLAAMIHVYDPSEYASDGSGDMIWRDVLGHAAYKGVAMEVPEAKIEIGAFTMDGFKARQPKHSFATLLDKVMAHPEASDQAMNDPAAREGIVDMLSAFSMGRFGVSGIKVQATGNNQFELADFHISDLSIEGLGEMAIEGLAGNFEGQGSLKIGRFAFGAMKFMDVDVLRSVLRSADEKGNAEPSPAEMEKLVPKLGFMEASGIDFQGAGVPHVALEKMRVDLTDYVGFIPSKIEETITNLDLPLAALDQGTGQLWQQLGYSDNLRLSLEIGTTYDDPTGTITLRTVALDVDGVGKLALDGKISGIPLAQLTDAASAQKAFATGRLESFRLRFDNSGVVEKLLKLLADQSGAKPEDIVAQATQPVLALLADNQAFRDKVSNAISAFIKDPKSLVISATPKDPVPFPAIAGAAATGPQIIPEMIGADIRANE